MSASSDGETLSEGGRSPESDDSAAVRVLAGGESGLSRDTHLSSRKVLGEELELVDWR